MTTDGNRGRVCCDLPDLLTGQQIDGPARANAEHLGHDHEMCQAVIPVADTLGAGPVFLECPIDKTIELIQNKSQATGLSLEIRLQNQQHLSD